MIKFAVIILAVLIASFMLSYLSLGYQNQYNEPTERQNEKIHPFYELWIYIGIIVVTILIISKYIHKTKNKHSN